MACIRKTACAGIVLVLTIAASPFYVLAVPAGSSMFSMHTGPERCEAGMNCIVNCPMLAQVNTRSTKESFPRSSSGQSSPCPCSNASQPQAQKISIQGMIGLNGRVSGIRKIYPKNVLDHPQRKAVYDLIMANPGIDLGKIGKALDLNRETLRYHIDLLVSSNKIVVMKDHGIIRYYENHGRYGILQRRVLAHLWNPTAEQILLTVLSNPGITQGDIARRLEVTSPTVHWYMQRFTTDGIVTSRRMGRLTSYFVNLEALYILTDPPNIRQNFQSEAYA
ncbi:MULTISPECIES: winged helix-turn-helix transcriptional regulator [Methanosarcina]|uniref:Winged helix-turn-helix transcriptional regulator n=1 Tax=Methanosarcina mazei TaxID=2209 RepID=A0A0F8RSS2_METMZ|nr:winged helix-turn-helix transcriptional regulator [Methanosarcina mazei]KKG06280.1 hypothetical protein DU47_13695 [Methanosarcina mazei]KKH90523.1 hypothetical protein DU80_14550 [Methanosarcina mazei]UWJ23468.1 Transcriptional regulator, ArsR family [Methanosarcina mazei TMA]